MVTLCQRLNATKIAEAVGHTGGFSGGLEMKGEQEDGKNNTTDSSSGCPIPVLLVEDEAIKTAANL